MDAPQYKIGDKVKFKGDNDGIAGEVLSISYDSERGYTYKISSRYFDPALNDMVDGYRIGQEKELVSVKTK